MDKELKEIIVSECAEAIRNEKTSLNFERGVYLIDAELDYEFADKVVNKQTWTSQGEEKRVYNYINIYVDVINLKTEKHVEVDNDVERLVKLELNDREL